MTQQTFSLFDFHADDFGISINSCNDILKLAQEKKINSLSILPNMNTFSYAVELLKKDNSTLLSSIKITVHLNFMEGHCCSDKEQVSSLVDKNGYFKISWGKLFIYNYIPFLRAKIKKQLCTEIISQTQKCIDAGIIKDKLRFDGHQHTHMIPLVFEALLIAVKHFDQKGFKTEYIRNTQDPIRPYYKAKEIKNTFNKINLIKCIILNYYSIKVRSNLKKMNLPVNYLCGVFFSGNMDFDRLSKILLYYIEKPLTQKRIIEILFHPGEVLKDEITEEFVKPDFNIFHLSDGRKIEFSSLQKFSETNYINQLLQERRS